jgi:hypothetical protein
MGTNNVIATLQLFHSHILTLHPGVRAAFSPMEKKISMRPYLPLIEHHGRNALDHRFCYDHGYL